MTSPFQEAAALASAAIDDFYSEAYLYQPMLAADVNARSAIDPARAPLTIMAAMLDNYARADSGPARTQGVMAEKPGHASSRPQVSIATGALPYETRRGDRMTRVSDGALFQVAECRSPDLVRITLDLNRMG